MFSYFVLMYEVPTFMVTHVMKSKRVPEIDGSLLMVDAQWSHDSKYLFTLDQNGYLRIWNVATGKYVKEIDTSIGEDLAQGYSFVKITLHPREAYIGICLSDKVKIFTRS